MLNLKILKQMKKLQFDSKEAEYQMLNQLLKTYKTTVKEIIVNNLKFKGEFWLDYFQFTEEEYNEWRSWCKEFIRTKCVPKMNDEQINAHVGYFFLKYPFVIKSETKIEQQ